MNDMHGMHGMHIKHHKRYNQKGNQRAQTSANAMSFFYRCALSSNAQESFDLILDPDAIPDHHQNLITPKFGHV